MENIEDKLKNYRLRKRRQEILQRVKDNVKGFLMLGVKGDSTSVTLDVEEPIGTTRYVSNVLSQVPEDDDPPAYSSNDEETESLVDDEAIAKTPSTGDKLLKYTLWVVYFAFWVTLYIISIELQFGIVFLMISALVAIYLNTRTGPRKRNEVSAYSVFNKNCESIDGTLKAEQFEREIGIR